MNDWKLLVDDLNQLALHTDWTKLEDPETFGITAHDAIFDDDTVWKAFQTRYYVSTTLGYVNLVLEARK